MEGRYYRSGKKTYGPEEYEKDKKEWMDYACSKDPAYREDFRNDAFCAKDRMDAYEKGENPLHANVNYQRGVEALKMQAEGCGCLVFVIIIIWIFISVCF